ncbi:MAG: aspartate aminotransferase family protein, partial [SAR324 cluster bacterium]|nr:aspartate aminotransferase family protein [SAR324 cluster bacterium]
RSEIISTVKAYHGHTGFALSANGKEHYRKYFEPLIPEFRFVPFNDLHAMNTVVSEKTAAILVEPVQGEAGIFVGTPDYLKGLRQLCDKFGCLLIFDEVQTGFGRTGKMFACEHSSVVPDIMALAKSMGGGVYANAAVLYQDSATLVTFVEAHPEFHTYWGGTDLGCEVSLAVLEYLQKNRLWEHAERMGKKLQTALSEIQQENPEIIREIRGIGLMIGVEYLHEFMGPMMSDALARNGVFAVYSGNAPQVMRFMFPLVISEDEMEQVIDAIRHAVHAMKWLFPVALHAAKIPFLLDWLNDEKFQTTVFNGLRKLEDLQRKLNPFLRRKK